MGVFQSDVFQAPPVYQQESGSPASCWFQEWQYPSGYQVRSRRHALDQFNRKSANFVILPPSFSRDWFFPLSEPVRGKPPLPRGAMPFLSAMSANFIIPPPVFFRDWFFPLSEPVRRKPPLPIGALPFLFHVQTFLLFSLSITETADVAALSFAVYTRKNLARVAITEIWVDTAHSTIKEIRYDRGYS